MKQDAAEEREYYERFKSSNKGMNTFGSSEGPDYDEVVEMIKEMSKQNG